MDKTKNRAIVATALLAIAVGCSHQSTLPNSKRATSLAEAGTVLVSPTMVAPWDEVSASLKPNFALTGDQASSQVLPNTEAITEQVLNAFGASLAVGLPTTSTASKTTLGGSSPGTTTTITKNPGTAPTISNTIPSAASLPSESSPTGTLGLDPVLKFKAANYLFQEVQLLNQEIDNAANRSCYVSYIVKLKLAVMNFRPRLPYSVHAHIGFLYNGVLPSNTRDSRGPINRDYPMPEPSPELALECRLGGTNPAVVPLLVADDVQTALLSRAAEAATQLSFGLSALIQGAGIGANVGSLQQSLTAISNHELTSTLTIGRESENSLYALITPNNQASNAADLVSQTYDVAVLLLIPRFYFSGVNDPQSPIISVSTYSEYRDAMTGKVLQDGSSEALLAQVERVIPPHLTDEGLKAWKNNTLFTREDKLYEARLLADSVKTSSEQVFYNRVMCVPDRRPLDHSKLCPANQSPYISDWLLSSLWTDAATLLDYDDEKLAVFQAQLPTPIKVSSQQILLNDDGNNPVQVVLGGVSGRSASKLDASLLVTPFNVKTWKSESSVQIPAQTLALDATAHTLTMTFPSLKKLNITCLSPIDIPPKPKAPLAPAQAAAPAVVPGAPPPAPLAPAAVAPAAVPPIPAAGVAPGGVHPGAPAHTAAPKHATVASAPAGTADTPKDPDCPLREANAGTADRPNGILLQLVGCDPEKQLCPSVTDTAITTQDSGIEDGSEDWLENKRRHVLISQQVLKQDIAESTIRVQTQTDAKKKQDAQKQLDAQNTRDSHLKGLINALGTAVSAIERVGQAHRELTNASPKDKNYSLQEGRFRDARLAWRQSWDKVLEAAIAANLWSYIEDHATIGVTLYASQQPTNPAKVKITNTGATIPYDNSGAGQLVLTVTPTPATDTVGISLDGASLKSVVDATGTTIAFNAKHGFVLPQAGVYTLNLTSLSDKHLVTLTAQALKGDANDGQSLSQPFSPTAPQQKPQQQTDQTTTKVNN